MGDIIIPGLFGIGTVGITPTESGYKEAARRLVELKKEGRHIDESDYEVRRVLDFFNCFSVDDLKYKI
ncbi:hypothetical protein IKF21_00675 [Candidatus Saccharibacteria bacterium]|nr:hypothetical protein [Candidatus Saccharibacteria bacterium]